MMTEPSQYPDDPYDFLDFDDYPGNNDKQKLAAAWRHARAAGSNTVVISTTRIINLDYCTPDTDE